MNKFKWQLLLFVLIILAFFSGQHILELRAEEPRRAVVSMEMFFSGNYLVPHVNEWPYFNKPPLFNWIQLIFFNLFGSFDEWVARLPSLLSFLGLAYLVFKITSKYLNKNLALLIALMTLTSADLLFYGTVNSGEIDLFFSLLVFVQVASIFHFTEQKKWLMMFVISYFFMALGILTKGPPSIAFQILTLVVWLSYLKKHLKLFSWQHLAGIFVSLIISGSYFLLYQNEGSSLDFIGRLFTEASQKSGIDSSFIEILKNLALFPLNIIKILLPWSLLLIWFKWQKFKKLFSANKLTAFSSLFIIANIWIYWFTGESKDRYIYMFIPFFLIILVQFYNNAKHIYYLALILLIIRIVFNFTYLPVLDKSEVAEYREISNEIIEKTKDKDLYLFGSPQHIDSKIGLGPFNIYENRLKTAPLFAYQFNYYISKSRNSAIPFRTDMDSQGYYILPLKLVDEKKDSIVYTFFEKWQQMERAILYVE